MNKENNLFDLVKHICASCLQKRYCFFWSPGVAKLCQNCIDKGFEDGKRIRRNSRRNRCDYLLGCSYCQFLVSKESARKTARKK